MQDLCVDVLANKRQLTDIAEREGEIVTITLNRPEAANALDSATLRLLLESMDKAEHESGVRAVILRGNGKHFCAGADLRELSREGPRSVRELLNLFRNVTSRFEDSPLLIVAAVHGAARAGGLELVLSCDAVIASTTATFGDAHLANGLLPGGGSSARLPRTVGRSRARWMILTAAVVDAQRALDWGLCMEVVPQEELEARAFSLTESMIVGDSEAILRAKRLLSMADDLALTPQLEMEISLLEGFADSRVFKDGIGSFLSRRR